ncbi:MAG: phosphate ABC transporter substrate-binding protein PstS family protein [Gemmatimonadetes bacterium]|nr:PstS family phosphate ABC transporter substrate-binding protein [Gemmatimonadota bacterium]NIR78505.1 PstS family phosphate ABC transporter substrate-binding protein [Gemmatimonadota bacterium]NIT87116.1 PstS family phosphate ABC transporter substrate-binding protein [Gemmatimonadota bacterium]NIU30958.1 PstS family phosphate ABC transporter substrate-binding protein [Gemmatimonadota bacterium]NIU35717.1 phosphate ABC transporter substrate-binding protein PstS family protein [Gemmatimonadota
MKTRGRADLLCALIVAGAVAACGGGEGGGGGLAGEVESDGSSTVYPVAEAVAEEFQIENPRVRVTVGVSGTGGGFKRFCAGETDISNASREIRESEREACAEAGVEFIELPVAWDGLSVVVNPENDLVECLTVEALRRIWEPNSTVTTWRDVRPEWPAEEIRLYGPGTDSGTFDYFTEAIVGESGASRPDYQASEDDNVLVQGVAGDRWSLGYFGYAYYVENPDKLKLVAVDEGDGCVRPSEETIEDQSYSPLSRPLYVYVRKSALQREEVRAYVGFMLSHARELVPPTGYIPLSPQRYQDNLARIEAAVAEIS